MRYTIKALLYLALLAGSLVCFAALQPDLAQDQWEEAIQAFEQMDETDRTSSLDGQTIPRSLTLHCC